MFEDVIPARYIFVFLSFFTMLFQYAHRVIMGVAIVAMINDTNTEIPEQNQTKSAECPQDAQYINVTYSYREKGEYFWSPPVQGIVLGSFFYGLVFGQLLAGWIIGRFGAKNIYVSSTLVSSLSVFVIPLITDFGVYAIVLTRIITGFSQGLGFPAMYNLLAKWSPLRERSTLVAICVSGNSIGTVLCMTLTGYLCEYGFAGGWPSAFYVFGSGGCVVFLFLLYFVYEMPESHPRITKKELLFIQQNRPHICADKENSVPWKHMVTSEAVWAVAIVKFCWSWGYFTLLTKIPLYLDIILHYPIDQNGFLNALFHTAEGICSMSSGFLSDFLRNRQYFKITTIRKIFETGGMMGPSICLLLITWMGCNTTNVIILLTLGLGLFGLTGGGDFPIVVDLAPRFAGTVYSFANSIGCIAGFLSPYIAGVLLKEDETSVSNWHYVLYISAGFYAAGAIAFLLIASAEVQPWADNVQKTENVIETKIEFIKSENQNTEQR